MDGHNDVLSMEQIAAILTDETADSPDEVFRRCRALEQLAASGPKSIETLPAILRSLVVGVSVDCVLALRVAAAEAVWKVGMRHDLALPFLAWALKDEYWGASRKAAQVLYEMGAIAHDALPDLVNLAERRLDYGPFHFETLGQNVPLLPVVASALASCGHGMQHIAAANRVLMRIMDCDDIGTCAAAQQAIKQLQYKST